MTHFKKNHLKSIIKLSISIILLILLFQRISLTQTIEQLKNVEIKYFATALFFLFINTLLQAKRWKNLILWNKIDIINIPKYRLFVYYILLGNFFNLFMPTGIGGDIVKSYGLGKKINDVGKSISSLIIARVLGFTSLLILFWIGFIITPDIPLNITLAMTGLSFCSSIAIIWLFSSRLNFNFSENSKYQVISKIKKLINQILDYKAKYKLLLPAFAYSIAIQTCTILIQYFLFKAISTDIPLIYFFTFIPVVTYVTMLPITIYGVGLREWIIIVLFKDLRGISEAVCMAASFLSYISVFIVASIGGVLFLSSNFKRTKK